MTVDGSRVLSAVTLTESDGGRAAAVSEKQKTNVGNVYIIPVKTVILGSNIQINLISVGKYSIKWGLNI